jgi:hypothetical protein
MTSDKFKEIVKNRANERVKEKVTIFEREVAAAFKKLHPSFASNYGNRWAGGKAGKLVASVFNHLLNRTVNGTGKTEEGRPSGYPAELWQEEEEAVTKELLATLDEMQKALMAPADTEPSPIAQEETKP